MGIMRDSGRGALFATAAGATAVHAVRLSWSLFLEYMASPTFGGDVADALCNVECISAFFMSDFNVSSLAATYGAVLQHRLVYRLTECVVSATCAFSSSPFLQGAVVYHYLYPTVQEYRFGRCWLTRLLRLFASCVIPKFFRPAKIDPEEDPDGAFLQNPPAPPRTVPESTLTQYRNKIASVMGLGTAPAPGATSSPKPTAAAANAADASARAKLEKEVEFYARQEAVFDAMPEVCAATLRYYVYSYHTAPFTTILQAGFIPDVSRLLMEMGEWVVIFAQERKKKTSRWRLWKRFLAMQASSLVQVALSYGVRFLGATLAMKLFREPTGGAIFWTESMLHFVLAMHILSFSMLARVGVLTMLDKKFPATQEDFEEDCRENAENEEAAAAEEFAAASSRWNQMAQEGLDSFLNGKNGTKASGKTGSANGSRSNFTTGGMIDLYAVLDVSDRASPAEIKKAYRQLALKNHPDRAGRDAEAQSTARERMAIINEAYDTLMDSRKKAYYDSKRRLDGAPNFVDQLEKMSTPKLTGMVAGLASLVGVTGYAHFVATFQRVTSSGRGPLMMFAGMT